MPEPKEWGTVKEAAFLTDRHVSRICRWIEAGFLATRVSSAGITQVLAKSVLRSKPTLQRG